MALTNTSDLFSCFENADGLRELIARWDTLSANLSRRAGTVTLPDLFVCSSGPGIASRLTQAIASYFEDKSNLMEFYGDVRSFEFVLEYSREPEPFHGIQHFIDAVRSAAGFRNHFKGIIHIQLDDWLGHQDEPRFISFMNYIAQNTGDWLIILSVTDPLMTAGGLVRGQDADRRQDADRKQDDLFSPDGEYDSGWASVPSGFSDADSIPGGRGSAAGRTAAMRSVVSMFLRIEELRLGFSSSAAYVRELEEMLSRHGLTVDESARTLLTESVDVLKKNRYFDATDTMSLLCSEIVYQLYSAGHGEMPGRLSAESLRCFAPDSAYIRRTVTRTGHRHRTIGFTAGR